MENKQFSYIILDQKTNNVPAYNVIKSTSAWIDYMKKVCKLRAKIFLDEGLIPEDKISSNGLLIDRFDELSTHFICLEGDKIVGALRGKILSKNFYEIESCILESFEEFGYRHHHKVLLNEYSKLIQDNKKILEYSKLIVDEDYRLFKNPESPVAISFFSFSRFFFEHNKADIQFITRGNKYQTKGVYNKMGYEFFIDPSHNEKLASFWKYGDINDLMFCSQFSELLKRVSQKFEDAYQHSIIIIKK